MTAKARLKRENFLPFGGNEGTGEYGKGNSLQPDIPLRRVQPTRPTGRYGNSCFHPVPYPGGELGFPAVPGGTRPHAPPNWVTVPFPTITEVTAHARFSFSRQRK
ncbi:Hypothetical protein NTJ_01833 [Nesidiocoris tenuis]|uniref:Uncharacterized protein n=1 Tax=Nesidiocoris tenuis TaxID=355587 RepID=A0ABN7ADT3_9HEMI|nr:Hypothetical protein NTJ_01833 [Nesidiocoris tenuis]